MQYKLNSQSVEKLQSLFSPIKSEQVWFIQAWFKGQFSLIKHSVFLSESTQVLLIHIPYKQSEWFLHVPPGKVERK